ncbi:probable serine/threonine-protein kinase DDB_G0282963 isoform X3 [Aricia agestis]|uniref:probable serine/threonine-protein kinase DDB_G0282963 isoform X3 n=1 Tax=Aricia agestis TaxID=91739 RepID=UPI001C2072BF|nr:probable serine/threonine-protein kinase DDB_G0282963 isoform X3 [Aricia agestis]
MAHVEPMDVDSMESDYEDKENSILHSNVIPKIPCTEKGYEELDASELNMKLRYSITPASSPMSRSYTANCKDNKNIEERNSSCIGNANLTNSFNSTLTNNDINNASKVYPLQTLPTENLNDMNRNVLLPKSIDKEDKNVTITVSNSVDENISIPSTSSSITHTPESTTPTKELPKDGGSPIMRGLRSVLSMFKPQSPGPSHEQGPQEDSGPLQANNTITDESPLHPVEVSTPLRTTNRTSPKRTSPHRDSINFNDDLEKELQWKDDSTILFKEEKIPKHKLFLQESVASNIESKILNKTKEECNGTIEYMDISYNDSALIDKTMTDIETKPHGLEAGGLESDGEFVDCETTFTKDEIESLLKSKENISMHNSIQHTSINAEAGTSDLAKNIHPLNLTIPVETSDLVWCTSNDVVNSEVLARAENDNIVSNNVLKQSFLLTCNDKSELVNNSDMNLLPVESSDLPVCISTDVAKSEDSTKAGNKSDFNNISPQNLSLTPSNININICENRLTNDNVSNTEDNDIYIKDENSAKNVTDIVPGRCTDLPVFTSTDVAKSEDSTKAENGNNSDFNNVSPQNLSLSHSKDMSDLPVNSDNVSNTEVNDIDVKNENSVKNVTDIVTGEYTDLPVSTSTDVAKSEDSTKAGNGAENFTDTAQHRKEERKNITFVTCENESYNNLHSAYENEIECKENCVEKIKDLVVNEDAKSENAVYGNSQSNDVDTILPQIEHEITCNENNREIIFEAIDFNLENKILEENNKEMAESLQTINNSSKTLEINVDFCEISQNNKGIDENAESLNEKVKNNNVDKNTKIVISEINKMLPMDVPLPTDSEFDKEIVDFCDANKIPDDLKVNEISESFEINANKDLDKLTYLLETPIEKIGDKTINQQSNSSHCKLDSTLKITDEKCVTVACNKTFDNNYSFEVIEKGQEEGESIVLKSGQSNNITMLNKSNADDIVIDDKPETFSNNSFQPTHDETFQCYTNESKSKNELSSPCDTNSNFENLGVEEFSNIKQLSNPFETKNKIQTSPPLSPVISSKGYNINFDDIEDPFATKIKIRQSPNPETSGHIALISEDNKSRKVSPKVNKSEKRKSYPIRKPMNAKNNSLNATFDCDNKKGCKANVEDSDKIAKNTKKEETIDSFKADTSGLSNTVINSTSKYNLDIKKKSLIDNKIEAIEEGHLFSKPTDPTPVRDITKSVFNCPEINDLNFCSITDKQKTMSSNLTIPSGDITFSDEDCPKANIDSLDSICPEVQGVALVDGETSISKDSKSGDIKEVNTEDEDTATFNETIEFIENDKENPNTEKDLLAFEVSHTALDNENIDNGEMFIDAEAFEFLLNQNQSNVIADSGKESLFLKFDPLFTKRVSSDGIIAALKKVQNNQSTPKKLTKLQLQTPSEMPGPSQKETVDDVIDEASIQAMTKPMMVVNPAINSIVSPRKAATPKVNRQSLTFTSPAMAVIDKLLSLSGSSLVANHNTPVSPVRQHNETDIAITQLREMLADKDIHVHNLKSESKELKDRLSSLEAQVKSLEVESAERLKKVNDLNERLLEKTKINKSMSNVVEEYERTISSLIAQIEQEKKNNAEERIMLIKERDEQTAHLASMEVSFNDLHSKYEKSKQLIYSMKANEETYKKSIQEFEESLTKMQNNYELLKQHATSKLNHANLELERFNRAHESEVLKLNALIKRKELHITSLEETLAQKTKANEELTAICDELINKVG